MPVPVTKIGGARGRWGKNMLCSSPCLRVGASMPNENPQNDINPEALTAKDLCRTNTLGCQIVSTMSTNEEKMASFIEDFGSDTESIGDVLNRWDDGVDDECGSIGLIKVEESIDQNQEVLSAPPKRSESPIDFSNKCVALDRLMKKYPEFIPARLPKLPRKRLRPTCLFINYMGSRMSSPAPTAGAIQQPVSSSSIEPSPYPTEAPTRHASADKRQRTGAAPSYKGQLKDPNAFVASPLPSLCPSSNPPYDSTP